jgi:hypothetical protein
VASSVSREEQPHPSPTGALRKRQAKAQIKNDARLIADFINGIDPKQTFRTQAVCAYDLISHSMVAGSSIADMVPLTPMR